MVVVRPGTIGPHPKGTAPAPDGRRRLFCFAMQSAARAAEKSWRRLLREDDRGEAGLRSDPIHSRPHVGGAGGNWNTTGDSGRFTKDDGGTALSQTPSASMARLSDTVSHGRERGPLMSYLRDAVVGNAEEDRP